MVLRSSCHTLRKGFGRRRRKGDIGPRGAPLPENFIKEIAVQDYDAVRYNLRSEVLRVLEEGLVAEGHASFRQVGELETLQVDLSDQMGSIEKQRILTDSIAGDKKFLATYRSLVEEHILPELPGEEFWYQHPPTLRVQPGPSEFFVKEHTDFDYGHQQGEINFWIPVTDPSLTLTTIWVEDRPIRVGLAQIASFHGTSRRHSVPANASPYTRVSLDFRIGIGGHFDPLWSLRGTLSEHGRIHVVRKRGISAEA